MAVGDPADELSDGVSCDVRFAVHEGRNVVVKTALPKLRVLAEWRADPARAEVEVRALQAARALLGEDAVPSVLWHAPDAHSFAMERIEQHQNFKRQLLAGVVNAAAAARSGTLLARLHRASAERPELLQQFSNREHFEALRVQPFFVRVAEQKPSLGSALEALVDRLRTTRTALVHGDFSPKNLLVQGAHVVVLDWEVAHAGDPAFDLAYFAHHLWLKAARAPAHAEALDAALAAFRAAYATEAAELPSPDHVTRLAAALGLARLVGDSPVEYRAELPIAALESRFEALLQTPAGAPLTA